MTSPAGEATSAEPVVPAEAEPAAPERASTGATAGVEGEDLLSGEREPAPRHPVALALLAMTGLLLVEAGARVFGRVALAYRRPASVRLTAEGLDLSERIEMLGRVIREQRFIVPLANLASVARETRFSRSGLYAGLCALALGTYFGAGLVVDGLRVPGGSPSLVGLGALAMAGGLGLDFGLAALSDRAKGRCRLVVVQRSGKALSVGGVDAAKADAILGRVAAAATSRRS